MSQPTHVCGHTLDVFITRSKQIVEAVDVDPPLLSDHSLIAASVDLHIPRVYAVSGHARCNWRSLDVDAFAEDPRQSALVLAQLSDVDDLFQCYDETLRSLFDAHLPLRMVSRRSGGRSARWYDAECRIETAKTRRPALSDLTSEAWSLWRRQFSRQKKLLYNRTLLRSGRPRSRHAVGLKVHVDKDQLVTDTTIF